MVGFWIAFAVLVAGALAFDLGVMGRRREITLRASLYLTGGYVGISLLFAGGIWLWRSGEAAITFVTAYALEKSLSLDNIFLFYLLFDHFRVPRDQQHRVLFWGVLGALALRGTLIFAGIALLNRLHWAIYGFALVVIVTGVRLLRSGGAPPDLEKNRTLRLIRRYLPVTKQYRNGHFLVRDGGRRLATPLLVALLMIESTDLLFALDSIPAVFGITRDPFLVYTSNVFAVLGLRALYFALRGMADRFRYLHFGLALVLILIGIKMVLESFVAIPTWITLGATLAILAVTAAISAWRQSVAPG